MITSLQMTSWGSTYHRGPVTCRRRHVAKLRGGEPHSPEGIQKGPKAGQRLQGARGLSPR